jgi:hypothetical protein
MGDSSAFLPTEPNRPTSSTDHFCLMPYLQTTISNLASTSRYLTEVFQRLQRRMVNRPSILSTKGNGTCTAEHGLEVVPDFGRARFVSELSSQTPKGQAVLW